MKKKINKTKQILLITHQKTDKMQCLETVTTENTYIKLAFCMNQFFMLRFTRYIEVNSLLPLHIYE